MIVEVDAFLRDPAQFGQGENLEPAAVGQDWAIPSHKAMETSEVFDDIQTGSQEKMVSVAKDHLSAN